MGSVTHQRNFNRRSFTAIAAGVPALSSLDPDADEFSFGTNGIHTCYVSDGIGEDKELIIKGPGFGVKPGAAAPIRLFEPSKQRGWSPLGRRPDPEDVPPDTSYVSTPRVGDSGECIRAPLDGGGPIGLLGEVLLDEDMESRDELLGRRIFTAWRWRTDRSGVDVNEDQFNNGPEDPPRVGNIKLFRFWENEGGGGAANIYVGYGGGTTTPDDPNDLQPITPGMTMEHYPGSTDSRMRLDPDNNFDWDTMLNQWGFDEFEILNSTGTDVPDGNFAWIRNGRRHTSDGASGSEGQLILNTVNTFASARPLLRFAPFQFQFTHSPGYYVYVDTYYADDSDYRVYLSEQSVWNDTTIHKQELQIPVRWVDNSIHVRVRRGELDNFTGKYLYVVRDGTAVNTDGMLINV